MAKLKGPLLSLGASGSLAKTIVFSAWKGISLARTWSKPTGPATQSQLDVRNRFGYLAHLWSTYDWAFPWLIHHEWTALCTYLGIASTGIGQFVSEYYHRDPESEVFFRKANIANQCDTGKTTISIEVSRPNVEVIVVGMDIPYPGTAPTLSYYADGDGKIEDELPFYWNYEGNCRCFSDYARRDGSTGLINIPGP